MRMPAPASREHCARLSCLVDLAAVADAQDEDEEPVVLEFAGDAVDASADCPLAGAANELGCRWWSGLGGRQFECWRSFVPREDHLTDPVPVQVQEAKRQGTFDADVGGARNLRFEDDSFDVAQLFGQLYHLAERTHPLPRPGACSLYFQCLGEAVRVVRSGGWVFAAAIHRFVRHAVRWVSKAPRVNRLPPMESSPQGSSSPAALTSGNYLAATPFAVSRRTQSMYAGLPSTMGRAMTHGTSYGWS
jgi:SAM-dependent methyltransferase